MSNRNNYKLLFALLLVSLLIASYLLMKQAGITDWITQSDKLISIIQNAGYLGPLIIIGSMILAIVFNPLPSAPIALTSGALYGHTWGTLYIICGALTGSIVAFLIGRYCGRHFVQKIKLFEQPKLARLGSQNSLMSIIFISRLLPFLSFDLVSYAAGLTPITLWRFIIATLFGLIPASFLLAHFGGEMALAEVDSWLFIAIILGAITLIPVLFKISDRYLSRSHTHTG